jgi:DNA-binding response OmpR family regulator
MEERKVLFVDDRPDQVALLRNGLAAHNCLVYEADTLSQARAHLAAHDFDLIVLDREIQTSAGVEDGLDLCRHIRKMGVPARIVFYTNLISSIEHREGWVAGADDYIQKTWSNDVVLARCLAHLERVRPQSDARAGLVRYSHPELPSQRALIVDETSLFVSREEDFEFMRQAAVKKRLLEAEDRRRFAALKITSMDQTLFFYLYSRPNEWVSEEDLLRNVWGLSELLIRSMLSHPDNNGGQVQTGVSRLRRKIDARLELGQGGQRAFGGRSAWAFVETSAADSTDIVSYRFALHQLSVSTISGT